MTTSQTILIVDDDDDARSLVKTILTGNGFEVVDLPGGAEALEFMRATPPALLVLDLMMPEVSGYDVLVHMKQRPEMQNIPVILLTAKGDAEDMLMGYKEYGVDYYITKPFTSRQLLAGVKLYMGRNG